MGWDRIGWNGMGLTIGWDGTDDGLGWDGMGYYVMGRDEMEWDGTERDGTSNPNRDLCSGSLFYYFTMSYLHNSILDNTVS